MNDIERAIDVQQKLIKKWENRAKELEEVIKKYPWDRDGIEYDFGDWREAELKRRKEQIEIALITIDALKKQTPKKVKDIDDNYSYFECSCGFTVGYMNDFREHKYCLNCGQKLDWEVVNE